MDPGPFVLPQARLLSVPVAQSSAGSRASGPGSAVHAALMDADTSSPKKVRKWFSLCVNIVYLGASYCYQCISLMFIQDFFQIAFLYIDLGVGE